MPKVMFGNHAALRVRWLNATKFGPFIKTSSVAITTDRFRPRTIFGLGYCRICAEVADPFARAIPGDREEYCGGTRRDDETRGHKD